jgi:hypothetical protein
MMMTTMMMMMMMIIIIIIVLLSGTLGQCKHKLQLLEHAVFIFRVLKKEATSPSKLSGAVCEKTGSF